MRVDTVDELVPRGRDVKRLGKLYDEMVDLESVSQRLQADATTMADVRILFDGVITRFPQLSSHLSHSAPIVHSPDFENGVVKVRVLTLLFCHSRLTFV